VPLGRNHARPSRTTRARPVATRTHGPLPRGARPVLTALARPTCAAHGHAATGERRGGTATDPGIGGFGPRRSGRRLGQDGSARGEACGGGSEGLSGGRRGAIGTAFKPPRMLLDSAAHGSQSRLGARDTATDRRAPRMSRLRI
jgi:hypothetical protein